MYEERRGRWLFGQHIADDSTLVLCCVLFVFEELIERGC